MVARLGLVYPNGAPGGSGRGMSPLAVCCVPADRKNVFAVLASASAVTPFVAGRERFPISVTNCGS